MFVLTKVGQLQPEATESDVWLPCEPGNIKGNEEMGIDYNLEQLGLEYVDCLLVHSPICSNNEFSTACLPHFFEWMN